MTHVDGGLTGGIRRQTENPDTIQQQRNRRINQGEDNMFGLGKKKEVVEDKKATITIRDHQTEEVEIVKSWVVEWVSRDGEYSGCTSKEFKVFANEDGAKSFKKALQDAFKLIKHTSQTRVIMRENHQ